jgi:hypothetical protein
LHNADLWRELGESMRRLRRANFKSLRQVEAESGWGRGLLSQVENGKARPAAELVEFYDLNFGGDGLLIALQVDAYMVQSRSNAGARSARERLVPGDRAEIAPQHPAQGLVVAPSASVEVVWAARNTGSVPWRGRRLHRVGAVAGTRVISSPRQLELPDVDPGDCVEVQDTVTAPAAAGTMLAHWRLCDADGAYCFASNVLAWLMLVVG